MTSLNSLRNFYSYTSLRAQSFKPPTKYFAEFLQWHKKKNFGKYSVVSPGNVNLQQRPTPPHIPKPVYSETGDPLPVPFNLPEIKDEVSITRLKRACRLARWILEEVGQDAKVGKTTDELDALAHKLIVDANAYPSPLNYRGFPKSLCTSVNNVCCHGIPDDRPLEDGDIVNIDVTVYLDGYHGDCSRTFLVGNVDDYGRKLVEVSELCLAKAIEICGPNVPFCMIGNVTEETAKNNGFTIVPAILGHGIGSYFHGPPEVWHICNNYGGVMKPGNAFTIEPAVTQGGMELEILEDGWTAVTVDQARSAQCEHTVLITDNGAEILTDQNTQSLI